MMLMKVLIGILLALLAYMLAHLFLNEFWSSLAAILVFIATVCSGSLAD